MILLLLDVESGSKELATTTMIGNLLTKLISREKVYLYKEKQEGIFTSYHQITDHPQLNSATSNPF